MKNVIFLCGIPASGKSTYANYFKNIDSATIISRDKIRREYCDNISEQDVTNIFNDELGQALKRNRTKLIIIDNTNVKAFYIQKIINYCISLQPDCKFSIKIFDTEYNECVKRNNLRVGVEHVPANVMQRMKNNYDTFTQHLKLFVEQNNISIID